MVGISSLRVTVKRSREKKLQEETEQQQLVIVTENNLFKDFTAKGVQNYHQKQSGKLDSDGKWCCGSNSAGHLPQREEFRRNQGRWIPSGRNFEDFLR